MKSFTQLALRSPTASGTPFGRSLAPRFGPDFEDFLIFHFFFGFSIVYRFLSISDFQFSFPIFRFFIIVIGRNLVQIGKAMQKLKSVTDDIQTNVCFNRKKCSEISNFPNPKISTVSWFCITVSMNQNHWKDGLIFVLGVIGSHLHVKYWHAKLCWATFTRIILSDLLWSCSLRLKLQEMMLQCWSWWAEMRMMEEVAVYPSTKLSDMLKSGVRVLINA